MVHNATPDLPPSLPSPDDSLDVRLHLDSPTNDGTADMPAPDSVEVTSGSPRATLESTLRAHSSRLRVARVRVEFEQTLLTVLALNVIYMYYIDHKLLVLFIRACQVIRLLHFPYASQASQRGTAVLLLVSNLPVLIIHKMLFTGPGVENNVGDMLFINFIGPEPKSLPKVLCVDLVIMALEAMLLQCKWEWETFGVLLLTALPVPISENLVPLELPNEPPGTGERETVEADRDGVASST